MYLEGDLQVRLVTQCKSLRKYLRLLAGPFGQGFKFFTVFLSPGQTDTQVDAS